MQARTNWSPYDNTDGQYWLQSSLLGWPRLYLTSDLHRGSIFPTVQSVSSPAFHRCWSLISILHIRFLAFAPGDPPANSYSHRASVPWRNTGEPQLAKAPDTNGYHTWEGIEVEDLIFPLSDTETIQLQKSKYTGPGWWYSDLLSFHWLGERRKQPAGNQRHLEECKGWWATPICSNIYTTIPPSLCRHVLITVWPQLPV